MIRFDETTGKLEGTNLPSVAEVIEGARARGIRFIRRNLWWSSRNCGCAFGVAAVVASGPELPNPLDMGDHWAKRTLGFDVDRYSYAVSGIFDGFDTDDDLNAFGSGDDHLEGAKFGRAVYVACRAAGLYGVPGDHRIGSTKESPK